MTLHARFTDAGQIDLPEALARKMRFKAGDELVVDRHAFGSSVFKTYDKVVREVQGEFRRMRGSQGTASVVDEFIAERRAEVRQENDVLEQWLAERR